MAGVLWMLSPEAGPFTTAYAVIGKGSRWWPQWSEKWPRHKEQEQLRKTVQCLHHFHFSLLCTAHCVCPLNSSSQSCSQNEALRCQAALPVFTLCPFCQDPFWRRRQLTLIERCQSERHLLFGASLTQ